MTVEEIGRLEQYLSELGYNVDAIIDKDKYNDWVIRQMYRHDKEDVLSQARTGWKKDEYEMYNFPVEHTVRFNTTLSE